MKAGEEGVFAPTPDPRCLDDAPTWYVGPIQNYESACFYEATEDVPNRGITKGDKKLSPVTNALI